MGLIHLLQQTGKTASKYVDTVGLGVRKWVKPTNLESLHFAPEPIGDIAKFRSNYLQKLKSTFDGSLISPKVVESRYNSFLQQTEGNYELLEHLLKNTEITSQPNLLQSILHYTNKNNQEYLSRFLNGNPDKINVSCVNALLALNRNGYKHFGSIEELKLYFDKLEKEATKITTDSRNNHHIMNALRHGTIDGKTPTVLNSNLLFDFENVMKGQNYYPKFVKPNSVETLLTKTNIGEAFSIDGQMYIKESESIITPLQYSEEVFERLFPAIDRFNICQGTAGDCFFISPLNSLMDSPKGRNEIYKMFTGSTLDKIKVRTARIQDEEYIFKDFVPLQSLNKNGLSILEQYQAVADFGEGLSPVLNERKNMSYIMRCFAGIPDLNNNLESFSILDKISSKEGKNIVELRALLKDFSKNPNSIINFGTKSTRSELDIYGNHVYAIKGYDPKTDIVAISNPWHGGSEVFIELGELDKYINYRTLLNVLL